MLSAESKVLPYKGLNPYDEDDADFFFGREDDTRLIVANLFSAPLTLLYGAGGVGKSSVLNAGVAHQLHRRSDVVPIVFSEWGRDPLSDLKTRIASTLSKRLPPPITPPPLTELPEYLAQWAQLLGCRLALILDQFEDYLHYHPRNTPFATELALAVLESKGLISFVISIREDSLARLDRFEGSIPTLFDNYLRLDPLDRKGGRDAIEKPVHKYNELYVPEGKSERYAIDPRLVDMVLEQVRTGKLGLGMPHRSLEKKQSQKYQLDTVFLQLVMTSLWNAEIKAGSHVLRPGTLDKLDGARAIVWKHLDKVMDGLTPEEQKIASSVFRYLVTPSGGKVAYPVDELADYERLDKNKLSTVLQKLSEGENRILRQVIASYGMERDERYEIFHDALGPAILDWRQRFVRTQEAETLQTRMEAATLEAKKQAEKKKRQLARLLWLMAFLLAVALTLLGFAISNYKHRKAEEALRAVADQKTIEANKQRESAEENLRVVRAQDLSGKFTMAVMRKHTGVITSAAFDPSCTRVITGSEDSTAIIWYVNSDNPEIILKGHSAPITAVAFSSDGNFVATASEDETARLWDARDGHIVSVMQGHTGPVNSVRFSASGNYLVTSSDDMTARVWPAGDRQSSLILRGHEKLVFKAEFSPNDQFIVTASADHTARVWDAKDGRQIHDLNLHRDEVTGAHFSTDGLQIVTASKDRTARIWETASGNNLRTLVGHTAPVNDAEFSPQGDYVVTASSDGTARIWLAAKGSIYSILRGHKDHVNTASFSPDGTRVITASDDRSVRTWNAQSQINPSLLELGEHTARVRGAVFGDRYSALSFSDDKTAHIWDVTSFGGFRVSGAFVDPTSYHDQCPKMITITARIEVEEGSGLLRYSFVKNGVTVLSKPKIISEPGEVYVGYSFRADGNSSQSGNVYLEVTEPNHVTSKSTSFSVKCSANPAALPSPAQAQPTP